MNRIRARVIHLAFWLVIFCTLERWLGPLHLSQAVYPLALGMGLLTLIVPQAVRAPVWAILAVPVPVLLLVNVWTGALQEYGAIPRLISDAASIGFTVYLARLVAQAIGEFERSVACITAGRQDHLPASLAQGESLLYREVRRARNHQRPLTLLAVGVEEKSIQASLDRMVREAQQAMIKHYAESTVSKSLCSTLEDSDIIVQSKDHFLIALPETRPENVPALVARLRQQVSEEVGVDLKIGTACLPADGFTLDGLIDKATRDMLSNAEARLYFEIESLPVRHNIP